MFFFVHLLLLFVLLSIFRILRIVLYLVPLFFCVLLDGFLNIHNILLFVFHVFQFLLDVPLPIF